MHRLISALAFAAERHRDQRRGDVEASPYINHPIALAKLLSSEAGIDDEKVLVAAVLHNTLEGTETTAEELASRFGDDVAAIVLEVSNDESLLKARYKRRQVELASTISRRAKLVRLAARIADMRDAATRPSADEDLQRRRDYFDRAKAEVDEFRGTHQTLERLFDEAFRRRP